MKILLLSLCFIVSVNYAQTLNIPARPGTALTGSQVVSAITSLSLHDREEYILNEVLTGNVPTYQRNLILVEDSALISGSYVHIEYYVLPDYLALGSDANYYLCPMTPILGQRLADSLDCVLPTRKMVDNIWSHATVKMTPESIPPSPQMTTVPVMSDHNDMVWTQRQTFLPGNPLGELVSGDKKDVVISNQIYSGSFDNVVIYGWHYPSGTNIQPLYNGHIDEYADYSHGIRLVQKEVYVDGTPMNAETIMASSTFNTLLSDEGVIALPFYPDTASGSSTPTIPSTPTSFCVLQNTNTSIQIIVSPNSNVDNYQVFISTDGINFAYDSQFSNTSHTVSGLSPNNIYYVKLEAQNSAGYSGATEVLAAVTTDSSSKYLIVNGFDRASTGNTYDFIRQHGQAIWNDTIAFSSTTNEAVINGLVTLQDYPALDYILGEESTVDETLNAAEQDLIEDYLDQGGYLFISGAEIAWDLHFKGSVADQTFHESYLKSYYVNDAPDGTAATFYDFSGNGNGLFDNLTTSSFDDGTHGTYNVDYPDVLLGVFGGIEVLAYDGVTNQSAGIMFEGPFPGAALQDTGKLVNFGFPFETIYPEAKRFEIMGEINEFFFPSETSVDPPLDIRKQNDDLIAYPNPTSAILNFNKTVQRIEIKDLRGSSICQAINVSRIDLSHLPKGVYLIVLENNDHTFIQKITKI